MEIARTVGLTMADVARLQDIFASTAKNGMTLSSEELYDFLKSRLRLKAAEGKREKQVRTTIRKHVCSSGSAGSLDFEDFLVIIGKLVDGKLATVPSIIAEEERSTNQFLGSMAKLLD